MAESWIGKETVLIVGIGVLIGLGAYMVLQPSTADWSEASTVSQDSELSSYEDIKTVLPQDYGNQPLRELTYYFANDTENPGSVWSVEDYGPWTSNGSYLYAASNITRTGGEGLFLIPFDVWRSERVPASLWQEVSLPESSSSRVVLRVRNGAHLLNHAIPSGDCRDSKVKVAAESGDEKITTSEVVTSQMEEITLDISKFSGQDVTFSAMVTPTSEECGGPFMDEYVLVDEFYVEAK